MKEDETKNKKHEDKEKYKEIISPSLETGTISEIRLNHREVNKETLLGVVGAQCSVRMTFNRVVHLEPV